jgi:hypothetical protein
VTWEWTEEHQEAFAALKERIAENVLLTAPRSEGQFAITTDASHIGLGAALLQLQNRDWRPLEFASKTLSAAQRK